MLIFFFAGLGGYYLKYKSEYREYKNYNYEKQDSLYNSAYEADNNKNLMEKVVDSKQELLDFSKDDKTIEDKKVLLESSVNINTASINELVLLPGIGEKTAEKIINLRSLKGKFSKLEELLEVKGIGPKTLEKMLPYITI